MNKKTILFCASLSLALLASVRPASSQQTLFSAEGFLEVVIVEGSPNDRRASLEYALLAGTTRYSLILSSEAQEHRLISGLRVRVRGTLRGREIQVQEGESGFEILKAAPSSSGFTALNHAGGESPVAAQALGEQRTAVILVNFSNDQRTPADRNLIRAMTFGNPDSVNAYYRESSYGKTWLAGDVFGWYTLPISSNTCNTGAERQSILDKTVAIADPDVDFSRYSRIVIAYPSQSRCRAPGSGTVGMGRYIRAEGGLQTVSIAWINTLAPGNYEAVLSHELGHNMGLYHANGFFCKDAQGAPTAISDNCESREYEDPLDIMGYHWNRRHTNASHKEVLGWLPAANIRTALTNANYSLLSLESNGKGIQAIRIPKDKDAQGNVLSWYYLEYRQNVGFDRDRAASPSAKGVAIRIGPSAWSKGHSQLIDTVPDGRFQDAVLSAGRTFRDPKAGVVVTTIYSSDDSPGANLYISVSPAISAVAATEITPTSAVITWTTDVPSDSRVTCDLPWLPKSAYSPALVTSHRVALTGLASGIYYRCQVRSQTAWGANNTIYTPIFGTFKAPPPMVKITSPANGSTVRGLVTINAEAAANGPAISGVIFSDYPNQRMSLKTITSSPYSYAWNTAEAPNGAHTLTATVLTTDGRSAQHSVQVIVSNNHLLAPGTPVLSAKTCGQIEASWLPSPGDPSGYRIDIALDPNFAQFPFKSYRDGNVGNVTRYTIGALGFAVTYYVRLRAYDSVGNLSAYSPSAGIQTLPMSSSCGFVGKSTGDGNPGSAPEIAELYAYPNPARAGQRPTFHADLGGSADNVELRVYNLAGESVAELRMLPSLKNGRLSYESPWEASGIPSGVYYFVARAHQGGQASAPKSGKVALIK